MKAACMPMAGEAALVLAGAAPLSEADGFKDWSPVLGLEVGETFAVLAESQPITHSLAKRQLE